MERNGLLLTFAIFFSGIVIYTDACSCMPAHPQEQFCRSDFVILARIKRVRIVNDFAVYKVRVRKEYKVSEKGVIALKSGRLLTPRFSAMCGAEMEVGKLYVISGHIYSLRAHINMCGMIEEWHTLTRRQRKGLKLLYKHGCSCDIKKCNYIGRNMTRCYRQRDSCYWQYFQGQCEAKEGICLRQSDHSCMWTRTKALTECRREYRKRHMAQ